MKAQVPVWSRTGEKWLTPAKIALAQSVIDSEGMLLFPGSEVSPEEFVSWTEQFGGRGRARLAPDSHCDRGPEIGLHTEDAMLPAIPAWVWFYVAQPADSGGESRLCDGAKILSGLSPATRSLFENEDVLYWWRTAVDPGAERLLTDPPGTDRCYRGPFTQAGDGFVDVTVQCRPLIRSRIDGQVVFANHILNTVDYDDGSAPRVNGIHRSRRSNRQPYPESVINELKAVAASHEQTVHLARHDILCLDNTRILHGRTAFVGSRRVLVQKSYHPEQHNPQRDFRAT